MSWGVYHYWIVEDGDCMVDDKLFAEGEYIHSLQRILQRYEKFYVVGLTLLDRDMNQVVSGSSARQVCSTRELSGMYQRAESVHLSKDHTSEFPALAESYRYIRSSECGSILFMDVLIDGNPEYILAITHFEPVPGPDARRVGSRVGMGDNALAVYTEELIIEILIHIQASMEEIVGYTCSQEISREELGADRKLIAQLQLLMRLWKAGRWEYEVSTGRNLVDENWKAIYGIPEAVKLTDFHDYFEEHVDEDDRVRLYGMMDDYLSGKTDTYHVKFRFRSEEKGLIWIEGIGVISEYYPDGTPRTLIGLNRDITDEECKRTELQQTNKLLRSLLENLPSGVFWKDVNSVYMGANDIFARNAGVSSYREVIGRTDKDLPNISDEYEHYRATDLKVMRTKKPILHEENILYRDDGRIGWSYTSKVPLIDDGGEVFGILGVYSDISELKWTEQQLVDRDRRLQAIVNCSSDIIWIIDSDYSTEYVSPSAERVLGYLPEELKLIDVKELMTYSSYDELLTQMRKIVNASQNAQYAYQDFSEMTARFRIDMITKDEDILNMDVALTPLVDNEQKLFGYLAVIRDITEQNRLHEELRQSQKMEAVGRLAGGVAHDFNNLLQVILGYSELLEDSVAKGSPESAMLGSIIDAGKQAKELVEQLLKFGQKARFHMEVINPIDHVEILLPTLKRLVGPEITVSLQVMTEVHEILADLHQLDHLYMNLCINAKDAISTGGEIHIILSESAVEEPLPVHGGSMPPGRYIEIAVADTGVGMTPEQLSVIFEPFYTTKVLGHGAGLGLSVVYGIVKEHSGYIAVESRVNRGTRFTIYLPVYQEEAGIRSDKTRIQPGVQHDESTSEDIIDKNL